jgi:HSP20 family protein
MTELDWRTVRELMALRARMKELMERAMLPDASTVAGSGPSFECPVDVWESDSEVVVEAEVPGVSVDDVEARLDGDALVLSGELPAPPEESGSFLRIERYRGPFRRVVALPSEVTGQPRASLRAGVLQIRLPKRRSSQRRRIAVEEETP